MDPKTEPRASLSHIINVNFGLLGIAFCSAIFYPYTSMVFIFLGAEPATVAYLWLIPPMIGLFLQPIIGHLSDRTVTKYGKRRPYILVGIISILLFSFLLPFCGSLASSAIVLGLLVAVVNIAQVPLRSLVAETIPKHQLTFGFSVQAIFLGVGATCASALPWLLNKWLDPNMVIPLVHQPAFLAVAFFICGIVALCTGLWTCIRTPEISDPTKTVESKLAVFTGLRDILSHFWAMPKVLRRISITQFFLWSGYFIFLAYFNLSIAEIFGLPPGSDVTTNPEYKAIAKNATVYSSLCFVSFQLSSLFIAMMIPVLTRFIHRKKLLSITVSVAGLSLLALSLNPSQYFIPAAIGLGLAWGSSFAIHYAMVASNLAKEKIGLYLGIFNVAVTSAQICMGLALALIIKHLLHNRVIEVVVFSGWFFIIAAALNLRINDEEK